MATFGELEGNAASRRWSKIDRADSGDVGTAMRGRLLFGISNIPAFPSSKLLFSILKSSLLMIDGVMASVDSSGMVVAWIGRLYAD